MAFSVVRLNGLTSVRRHLVQSRSIIDVRRTSVTSKWRQRVTMASAMSVNTRLPSYVSDGASPPPDLIHRLYHTATPSSANAQYNSRNQMTSMGMSQSQLKSPKTPDLPVWPPKLDIVEGAPDRIDTVRIETREQAEAVLATLASLPSNTVFACDTETTDLDISTQGPVGNGRVICASIYGGPHITFRVPGRSSTDPEMIGSTIWIDNYGEAANILQLFKPWFENPNIYKVWHNYGFDRHVMDNEGIHCMGFFADTMHLARLWDNTRNKLEVGSTGDGYSLSSLTQTFLGDRKAFQKVSIMELFGVAEKLKDGEDSKKRVLPPLEIVQEDPLQRDKWIEYSARDAVATWMVFRKLEIALKKTKWPVMGPDKNMYDYYHCIWRDFGELLTDIEARGIKVDVQRLANSEKLARDQLAQYEKQFREWVEEVAGANIAKKINVSSTKHVSHLLFGVYEGKKQTSKMMEFDYSPTPEEKAARIAEVNAQNPFVLLSSSELTSRLRAAKIPRHSVMSVTEKIMALTLYEEFKGQYVDMSMDEMLDLAEMRDVSVKKGMSADDLRRALTITDMEMIMAHNSLDDARDRVADINSSIKKLNLALQKALKEQAKVGAEYNAEIYDVNARLAIIPRKNDADDEVERIRREIALEKINLQEAEDNVEVIRKAHPHGAMARKDALHEKLTALKKLGTCSTEVLSTKSLGLIPTDFTPGGSSQLSLPVLHRLAGKNLDTDTPKYGSAFDQLEENGYDGARGCQALAALASISQLETLITSFFVPLQTLVDKNSRIHCSLNLNTETGRLSARRPNLQNQPALEKDKFKIRDCFVAEPGNTLIVADYGQLELRVMAHITNCESMLTAFREGGCFHSRTAVGMYTYIQEAIDRGEVLLEWDYSQGQPTVPLVKDTFASERRKAKTLNFSIAYGKTIIGLASDWNITTAEAQKAVDAWYDSRPEVRDWQKRTQKQAREAGYVSTMTGRYRILPYAMDPSSKMRDHSLRAAINTPIQGSAADVVILSMIRIWKDKRLRELGWHLLLQIHDEVIMEGPVEHRDEALKILRNHMENPFPEGFEPLRVHLDVDAKSADTWYLAK